MLTGFLTQNSPFRHRVSNFEARIPRQIEDPFLTATIETWGAPSNIQQRATTQGCEDTSILDQEWNTLPDWLKSLLKYKTEWIDVYFPSQRAVVFQSGLELEVTKTLYRKILSNRSCPTHQPFFFKMTLLPFSVSSQRFSWRVTVCSRLQTKRPSQEAVTTMDASGEKAADLTLEWWPKCGLVCLVPQSGPLPVIYNWFSGTLCCY